MRQVSARSIGVISLIVLMAGPMVGLSGCAKFKRTLGLEKKAPDEFAVVARAPLSMPPDLKLRPPRPGEAVPNGVNPVEDARRTVFNIEETRETIPIEAASPGEAALLGRAGVDRSQSNIRRLLDEENSSIIAAERSVADTLLFWRDQPEPPTTVVDAAAETQRLQRNRSLGLPPTEGDVPSVTNEVSRGGLLEGLF